MSFGSRFLRAPEAETSDPRGAVLRGAERLELEIADLTCHVAGIDSEERARLVAHFEGFETAAGSRDGIEVTVRRLPRPAFRDVDTRGWEYDLDLAPTAEAIAIAGLGFVARVDRTPLRATLASSADPSELPGVVENVLRIVIAYALVERGGALVHGAGVVHGDGARVCFGVSGAGKTTLSRLAHAAGRRILSDDMVALVPEAGRVRARAIPFAGDFRESRRPESADLKGVFRLRQAPQHALRELHRAEALAALLVCTPYVNRDPWVADRLLANLEGLLRLAPARELAFAPEAGVVDVLEAAS